MRVWAPFPSSSPCASFFSEGSFGVPRSKPPGVFGVLADDPNEAKAPDPRPKAEEAPAEGEETFGDNGAIALKGLERLREPSKRLDERDRVGPLSRDSDPDVDSVGLLHKTVSCLARNVHMRKFKTKPGTYLALRVQRFAFSITDITRRLDRG